MTSSVAGWFMTPEPSPEVALDAETHIVPSAVWSGTGNAGLVHTPEPAVAGFKMIALRRPNP